MSAEDDLDDLIGPAPKLIRDGMFIPGGKGGPGRPPGPNPVARMSRQEVQRVGMMLLEQDWEGISKLAESKTDNALSVMLASVCLRVCYKGDMAALDLLLNRLIGKVRDELAVSGDLTTAQVIVHLPANGREAKEEK